MRSAPGVRSRGWRAAARTLAALVLVPLAASAGPADPREPATPSAQERPTPGASASPSVPRTTNAGAAVPEPDPLSARRPDGRARIDAGLRAALRTHDGPYRVLALNLDRSSPVERHVRARVGPVASLLLPTRADVRTAVRHAEALTQPLRLHARLDDADPRGIGVGPLDAGTGGYPSLHGRGVIVGAYDSGLDLGHPDLLRTDGTPRLVAWHDEAFRAVCTSTTPSCPLVDRSGHGTHVLGIAVGSGDRYRGVATEADLAMISSEDYEAFVEALARLDAIARTAGRPMVVNISLGGQRGAHDGTSAEALAIDAYPRLVVVAAGNEGALPVHVRTTLVRGATARVGLALANVSGRAGGIVDLWGAQTASVGVAVELWDGTTRVATSPRLSAGGASLTATVGPVRVLLDAAPGPHPLNGKPQLQVRLEVSDLLGGQRLALRLEGEGLIDGWVEPLAGVVAEPRFTSRGFLGLPDELSGDSALSLSELATARSALAVSSWIRTTRVEDNGMIREFGGAQGKISGFSSRGPTLDPARTGPKPDLAAPGQTIVSLGRSRLAAKLGVEISPLYRASQGTSMAVPYVAGAAALLLEAEPTLDRDTLRARLLDATREPPSDDPRWGRGPLWMERAFPPLAQGCGVVGPGQPLELALFLGLIAASRRAPRLWRRRSA